MKKILINLPWTRGLLYFVIMGAAMQVAGLVPLLNDFWFFFVISIACSGALLRLEGRSPGAVHLLPRNRRHWSQWAWGTVAGIGLLLVTAVITLFLTGDNWRVNYALDPVYIGVVFLSCLWSSVVQEFVFRGYPFQMMLDHYGVWKAQLFVAIPFALMHVQAGMAFPAILTTALTTGLGSVLFGMACARTRHLALPIGLHAGWNFAQALVPRAAGGNMAKTLLIVTGDTERYNFGSVVGPYILVTLVAIGVIARLKKQNQRAGFIEREA
ncbi:MAG TPA: type II CAAX endopeptidase family protein [Dyadobacter sp.]|nr:type II CAAX endopeptidase family protein [Dyadobacter sp.]